MEESKQFPTRHAPALEFEEEEEEQQNGHRAVAVEDAPSLASSDSSSSSSSSDDEDENGKTSTEKNTKKKTSTTADEGLDSDDDNRVEDDEHDGEKAGAAWFRKREGAGVSVAVKGLSIWAKDRNPLRRLWSKAPSSQQILNDVSCVVKPGQLLAILGSSGSGKTTLLNSLAGRMQAEGWTRYLTPRPTDIVADGDVLFNGVPKTPKEIRRIAAYVMQKDYILPHLTVRETLTYAGLLSLPTSMPKLKKLELVENVILELGLKDCANTKIGGENSHGISGGERRRVSIALQLLTDPSVLLLDEPTSGLDSFTANKLMNTLLDIAHQGRTVICTIHQPRSEMMSTFDLVLLLSKGEVVYFGEARDILAYFDELGYVCPSHVNPADYFLDLMTVDPRSEEAEKESKDRLETLTQAWTNSEDLTNTLKQVQEEKEARALNLNAEKEEKMYSLRSALPAYKAYPILVRRAYRNLLRDPQAALTRFTQVMAFAVIMTICFLRIDNDQTGVQNKLGFLYEVLSLLFVGQLNAIAMFPGERNVFYRERIDGLYGTTTFMLSYMSIEIPLDLISVAGCSCLTYFVIGLSLEDAWRFFVFYGVALAFLFTGETVGLFLCSLFYDVGIANMLSAVMFSLFLLMSGYFRGASSLPYPLRYANYGLITYYGAEVLAVNEFHELDLDCEPSQAVNGTCTYANGDAVIDSLNFDVDRLWPYFGAIWALTIIYRFVAFMTLKLKPVKPNLS